jgi:hypothetical protein
MIDVHSLGGRTPGEAWEAGLALFRSPSSLYRHDSERGVAFEIPGLTLAVESVADDAIPPGYAYPAMVDEYSDRLFGAGRGSSLLHRRMRAWPTTGGGVIDQIGRATLLLRSSPDSRAASFSLWDPEQEGTTDFPVSPVSGCFRVIDEAVHLLLVARSVDYWIGAVPEMLAFATLLRSVARELDREPAGLIYHMWSAHVYENDCLVHLMTGDRT